MKWLVFIFVVSFLCVYVCVCAHVTAEFRDNFVFLTHQQGTSDKWDVPGRYNHANQLLITFWTCLIYSMHTLKKSPQAN